MYSSMWWWWLPFVTVLLLSMLDKILVMALSVRFLRYIAFLVAHCMNICIIWKMNCRAPATVSFRQIDVKCRWHCVVLDTGSKTCPAHCFWFVVLFSLLVKICCFFKLKPTSYVYKLFQLQQRSHQLQQWLPKLNLRSRNPKRLKVCGSVIKKPSVNGILFVFNWFVVCWGFGKAHAVKAYATHQDYYVVSHPCVLRVLSVSLAHFFLLADELEVANW